MPKRVCILSILTISMLMLPATGALLSGTPLKELTTFPPFTEPASHPPFSRTVFLLYLLFSLAVLFLIILAARSCTKNSEKNCRYQQKPFPWWGWTALALMFLFWWTAWTRVSWLEPVQGHTFVMLWLCYTITVNGLCHSRYGFSLLLDRPLVFVGLFPLSAGFWWAFENLNQFVDNWMWYGNSPIQIYNDVDRGFYESIKNREKRHRQPTPSKTAVIIPVVADRGLHGWSSTYF